MIFKQTFQRLAFIPLLTFACVDEEFSTDDQELRSSPIDDGEGLQFCGGIANFPCPAGFSCVDDPNDDCDPKRGGADCGGVCVESEPLLFCGGIANFPCPEGFACVDDPDDDCDPKLGGADCGGVCVSEGGWPEY
ncbi:hypothetical protein ACNOYE_31975 [Nannocystaceae bacterium ST9]